MAKFRNILFDLDTSWILCIMELSTHQFWCC